MDISNNTSSIIPRIKVIGIGGAGMNVLEYISKTSIENVSFLILNSNERSLEQSTISNRIQLGPILTKGSGTGADPKMGKLVTEESLPEIKKAISENIEMAILVCGMGGGDGTGGISVVAKLCQELGILTIAIVSTPFAYEGRKRVQQAEEGIRNLEKNVDSIIVLANDELRRQYGNLTMKNAFAKSDETIGKGIKCIADVINSTGQINVDFADIKMVFNKGGYSTLGLGFASGKGRALKAIKNIFSSPLFKKYEDNLNAKWILININSAEGDNEFTMDEVEVIQNYLLERAGENCDVILGLGYDNFLTNELSIVIIATGLEKTLIRQTLDTYIDANNILPYALKQLFIKNFNSVRDLYISNIPVDANWIFFTGENGSGKTTLLQAIAIGILGNNDNDTILLQNEETEIILELKSPYGNLINSPLKKYEAFPKLVCYGPSRLLIQSEYSQNEIDKKTNTSYGLFNADGILLNIEHELLLWKLNKNARFKTVTNIIKEVIPEITQVIVEKNKVFYIDKTLNEKISFDQLPSGYRSIIAFIGDLIIRFF